MVKFAVDRKSPINVQYKIHSQVNLVMYRTYMGLYGRPLVPLGEHILSGGRQLIF